MSDPALAALDVLRATNIFGPLSEDVRERLQAVIAEPTDDTWNDASSIILNAGTHTTLWQAVIAVDPSFPRTGPAYSRSNGRGQWSVIPSRETLLAALRHAVDPPDVTCGMDPGRPDGPGSYHHGVHKYSSTCSNPKVTS